MRHVYRGIAQVFAVVLLFIGGGAVYGGLFAHSFITDQLNQERISMPTEEGIASLPEESQDALRPYIGTMLDSGPKAQAFADHYIYEHLQQVADGATYEEISGKYMKLSKDPSADKAEVETLGQQRQTLFMGDTLRGTLLNAYGWWTVGTVTLALGIAALVGAIILALAGWVLLRPKSAAV